MRRKLPAEVKDALGTAVAAAEAKQAADLVVLDLGGQGYFTDCFLICSARNPRQGQAISDEIDLRMSRRGLRLMHTEGYNQGDWILMDYGIMVVHIFSEKARAFYDLERLWRSAPRIPVEEAR